MIARTLLKNGLVGFGSRRFISEKTSHLVYEEYGDPLKVCSHKEALIEDEVKENEAFVKFKAAPVNPADINQIQGVYPVKPTLPAIGGNEGCGIVEAVSIEASYVCFLGW